MRVKFIFILLITANIFSMAQPVTKLKTVDDFRLSPYTGYTRAHWIEITGQILAGALSYVDPQTGIFNLPEVKGGFLKYISQDARTEAQTRIMERIMIGAVIYAVATGKDEVPGYKGSISKPFLNAIIRGTDPASDGYWGEPKPFDQIGVSFALGAYICPERFWNPLTEQQKQNLLKYLQKQSFNSTYPNNHYYFHMFAASLLEKYNLESNREHHTQMLERLMGWYRGDGWFIDGNNRGFDYYNLWGFQLFNQLLYRFDPVWREKFGENIQQTSSRFLETFPYLFGRDGAPIPWGRSLSYRFASNAAIAWAVINGNNTLSPGMARRIASGNLKYFWDNGCLGDNRLLNLGFRGMNLSLPERYLVPGDPYFALHGLACLLIPENHPFWTEKEEAMPADAAGGKMTVAGAEMVFRVSPVDGDARMYPVGQPQDQTYWQSPVKYCQHSYSSTLGFCLTGEDGEDTGANRTGYSYDGTKWLYRFQPRPLLIEPDHIESVYKLKVEAYDNKTSDYERDELITHTLIGNDGELHIFWHNYPDPIYLSLGGYGISIPKESDLKKTETGEGILIHGGEYYSILQPVEVPAGSVSAVLLHPREGWETTHLFGGLGVYPSWQSAVGVPPHTPVVIYVNGTKNRIPSKGIIKVEKQSGRLLISFEGKEYEIKIIHLL